MSDAYQELKDRGFIRQETAPVDVRHLGTHELIETLSAEKRLKSGQTTFYVGFDPTSDSLHVGSLMPIMAMMHLQRAGHIPICIIGGGTALIGDPSGKTQMRQMLSEEDIASNGRGILAQLEQYLSFENGSGVFVNNAEWLTKLNYIEFLRDIGKHFRVNEMLRMEAYKARLERNEGLSFIEFNYQLLQAYDFLVLFEKYGCTIQMGGDDQWGNILAGIDLIRKVRQSASHGLTFPLLTTASGQKMGKTETGAVWLDAAKTSPYEYYQFWINTDDRDVERFLKFFTFLPLGNIADLCAEGGSLLRHAKEVLAFEATQITHGYDAAVEARESSERLFASGGSGAANVPSLSLTKSEADLLKLTEILVRTGLSSSKSEATKLIKSGGVSVDNVKVTDEKVFLSEFLKEKSSLLLRKGKKTYHRVDVE